MFEPDPHDQGDMLYTQEVYERFKHLRDDGKPALIFAAHLANWELPALVASKYRLDTTVLYRRPNIGAVSDAIIQIRKDSMGTLVPTGLDAPLKLLRVLEAGGHVAMLVDQHYVNGVDVTFFGRRCKANPFIARLARHIDCPIHGTRVVRLPGQAALSRRPHRGDRAARATPTARSTSQAPCRRSRRWSKAGCASIRSSGCGCTGAGADSRYFPVLILVHIRFISRCVFGSWAAMV